jgi:hypothetical protein
VLPDQPGRVQVLPAQQVAVAAWAEVVEPATPVDAIDQAKAWALPSQLRAHRDADRQRLQLGMHVAGYHQPATGGVRGGENPTSGSTHSPSGVASMACAAAVSASIVSTPGTQSGSHLAASKPGVERLQHLRGEMNACTATATTTSCAAHRVCAE